MRLFLPLSILAALACAGPGGKDSGDDGVGGDGPGDDTSGADWTWTPVTIDFDDCDGNVEVDTRYPDVTFVAEDGYHLFCWDYATYARSAPYSAYTATSGGGAGARVDLVLEFTSPVRALQLHSLGDQTDGPLATVIVETEDGTEDTTEIVGDGSATTAELLDLSAWEHVVRVSIVDMEDAASVNYDDIAFERRE